MDNPSVIYEAVIPCPMFRRVSRLSPAFRSALLTQSHFGCVSPRQWAPCFHYLTNCFFSNPFIFTTIRIAHGVHPSCSLRSDLPLSAGRFPRTCLGRRCQTPQNHTVTSSLALPKKSSPLSSSKSTLFCKNTGVGDTLTRRQSIKPPFRGYPTASSSVHRWQVAASRAGCHNSTLRTTRLAARGCHSPFLASLASRTASLGGNT
jgi:hypothetical protein